MKNTLTKTELFNYICNNPKDNVKVETLSSLQYQIEECLREDDFEAAGKISYEDFLIKRMNVNDDTFCIYEPGGDINSFSPSDTRRYLDMIAEDYCR